MTLESTRGAAGSGPERAGGDIEVDRDESEVVTASSDTRDGVAIGLLVVVVGVVGIMVSLGELLVEVIPFLVVFVGLAVWTARSASRSARWIAVALLMVFLGLNSIYASGDLAHPESAYAFIPTVVVMGAGLVTVVLAAMSALRHPATGRRVWMAAGAGFLVIAGASVIAAVRVEDAVARSGDAVVTAADFEYPAEVRLGVGAGVVVENDDASRHTFVVDGAGGGALEVPAGASSRIELDLAPGTYRYYCDIAGHEAMEGTLEVS